MFFVKNKNVLPLGRYSFFLHDKILNFSWGSNLTRAPSPTHCNLTCPFHFLWCVPFFSSPFLSRVGFIFPCLITAVSYSHVLLTALVLMELFDSLPGLLSLDFFPGLLPLMTYLTGCSYSLELSAFAFALQALGPCIPLC